MEVQYLKMPWSPLPSGGDDDDDGEDDDDNRGGGGIVGDNNDRGGGGTVGDDEDSGGISGDNKGNEVRRQQSTKSLRAAADKGH